MSSLCFIATCGGNIRTDSDMDSNAVQFISSPNYPNSYPANTKCVWNIIGPFARDFVVQFLHFDTEDGYDTVQISGNFRNGGFARSLSGNLSSLEHTSFRFNENARLEFTSDTSFQGQGFQAIVRYGKYFEFTSRYTFPRTKV